MIGGQEENSAGMVADMITAPLLVPQSLGIHLPKTTAIKSPQQTNKGR
jgi:hypothetical protein